MLSHEWSVRTHDHGTENATSQGKKSFLSVLSTYPSEQVEVRKFMEIDEKIFDKYREYRKTNVII